MSATRAPADPLASRSGEPPPDQPQSDDPQSDDPQSDKDREGEARRASQAAVRLLSKRDHCTSELRRKLEQRDFDTAAVDSAIDEMTLNGYLDDERFAHLFAEQRMLKGSGPHDISARLRGRGVEASLARCAIDALDVNWQEAAGEALGKRFSRQELLSEETRQRARMARFLESRGYTTSDSIRAIENARQSARRQA